jgi:hypothetical protein
MAGNAVTLTWPSIPKATTYTFTVGECDHDGSPQTFSTMFDGRPGAMRSEERGVIKATDQNSISFPLDDPRLPFWSDNAYRITVDAIGKNWLWLSRSYDFTISKTGAPPRPKLTEANLRMSIPKGISLIKINRPADGPISLEFGATKPEWNASQLDALSRSIRPYRTFWSGIRHIDKKVNGEEINITVTADSR